ncbi:MAG: hypothetical protein M3Z22_05220 [Verrucomicrobiota bacterium]|nr:hypothetical protein [Verrucomicrobiota bacterium]
MKRTISSWKPVCLGLIVMLVQLFVAVVLIAPEGPLSYRYETLVQHDSYWFANIVERGYGTTVPPIDEKLMEVSNVAFFPAYPAIAALLHRLGLNTYDALLVTAQGAAWGFWSYFFLLCERWAISPLRQFFGATVIAAHPTAFFLIAAYSESLFMMGLLGFIYWSSGEGRAAKVLAVLHGVVMSATRIVGLPCAAYPVVRAVCVGGWKRLADVRHWFREYAGAVTLMGGAMLGTVGFFIYCFLRWGRWDLYMATQEAGWAIFPDYLAVFKLESYRWLIPPLNDPTQWSQMTMTVGALCFVGVAICELVPAIRRKTNWQRRVGLYFAALITFYIAVSGVASVQMESMLRYQFCAHALIVLAFLHFLAQFRTPPLPVRALGMAAIALLCAAGLSLQGWWIWNFTRGDWVA